MMKKLKKLLLTMLFLSVVTAAALIGASAASTAACAGKVSASKLNLREGAGLSSRVTTLLDRGDTVVILDKSNGDWYRVVSGGTTGYVASRYISEIEAAKNFTATGTVDGSGVRLRSHPTTDALVLDTYDADEVMNVIGINNGWYKVTAGEYTGYIRSDLLSLVHTNETAAEKAATDVNAAVVPAEAAVPAAAIVPADAAPAAPDSIGQQIAEYASQFAGYKYIYGASSPNVGFDCSGLTYYVYGRFGYPISRTASQQYKHNGTEVSKADLIPGDLVFFSSNGGKSVTHVGLYIGDGKFVNASTSRTGVIISSLSSSWYTKTWYGAKRIVS